MTTQPGTAGRGRTGLWVLVGVLALALVGMLVWGLVGRGGDAPPSPPPTTPGTSDTPVVTTEPPSEPTDEPTDEGSGRDWGSVTPPNADSLRDFGNPEMPETVGTFTRGDPTSNQAGVTVSYTDEVAIVSISANVFLGNSYEDIVAEMTDPQIYGNAVCGVTFDGIGDQFECVVAGSTADLVTGTAEIELLTIEDVAAFTNTLFDQL